MLEDDLKSLNLTFSTLHNLKKNYTALVLKYHPDRKTGNREKFTQIFEAYKRILKYTQIHKEIQNMEEEYVGSEEERNDIIGYYTKFRGDMCRLLDHLVFGKYNDEDRIRRIIDEEIENKRVRRYKLYGKRISAYKKKRESTSGGDMEHLQAQILANREQRWQSFVDGMEKKYDCKQIEQSKSRKK
ncbi:Molecular chaperone (DnaJ superfamily) [Trachipleistophora hominis]|uniref:Molecular chaperone (DnaJ superfamily) n=1 Tax=Trachipleistophora hominis TaxID=72359 RepID=L7K0B2_TRAHO|nr:Molecular chaperone (DnaJ superfamily) [Trachipleistophora hominis]